MTKILHKKYSIVYSCINKSIINRTCFFNIDLICNFQNKQSLDQIFVDFTFYIIGKFVYIMKKKIQRISEDIKQFLQYLN